MRLAPFILAAATLALPAMAFAQSPSTQPAPAADASTSDQVTSDQPSANPSPFGGEERRRGMRGMRGWYFNEEEWTAAAEFMQGNFKERWELYKTIEKSERNQLIRQVKIAIVNRYRQLLRMERDNPLLYEAAMKHALAEEEAYAAAKQAQEAPNDTQAQNNLRTQVEKLVEQTFTERQARLATLRTTLDQQEKQLQEDRQNREVMIKAQIDRLTSENPFRGGDSTMNPGGPRGGGGGGGGGGGREGGERGGPRD